MNKKMMIFLAGVGISHMVHAMRTTPHDSAEFRKQATKCERRVMQIIRERLANGASLNAPIEESHVVECAPLLVLSARARSSCIALMEQFLQKGARIDVKDDTFGHSPLHEACYWGNKEAVKLLLQHNADPNTEDGEGQPPLWHIFAFACKDHIAIFDQLANKTDLTKKDHRGDTVLHYAIQHYVECGKNEKTQHRCHKIKNLIGKFLAHGVQKDVCDNDGLTPADAARKYGEVDLANFIENYSGNNENT